MSYNFVDINEVSGEIVLPSEALQINGEYIENLISGYRTLSVTGREALSPELTTYETGVRDGSALKSRRYPARTITVKYQLIASSNEEFREAYNQLAAILDVRDAELIFADEQDKFFIGTPSAIGEVEPGRNAVIGEIDFFCADPFKYSVTEYEADPSTSDGSSILVDYGGTYKAFPVLEADFKDDCGYVAFFNEEEKIIQLGDPNEEDTESYPKSQLLISDPFNDDYPWGDTAEANWPLNCGVTYPSTVQQIGTVGMVAGTYYATENKTTSGTLLKKTKQSDDETPIMYYTVTAKTSDRTETTAKVAIAVTAALEKSSNYFGRGFGLKGSVYIGGEWHDVTIKKTTDYWKGNSGHTVNLTVTVEDLEAADTKITGIKFKATRTDSVGGKTGVLNETSCSDLKISAYTARTPESYCLGATSYGNTITGWHGPSITRTIPADAAGDSGAVNFVLDAYPHFAPDENADGKSQYGAFQVQVLTADDKPICGVRFIKNTVSRDIGLQLCVDGGMQLLQKLKSKKVTTLRIAKTGGTLKIATNDFSKSYSFAGIKTMAAAKITVTFEQYATKPALTYNGLYLVRFRKDNCDTWEDIPNKFNSGDALEADCSNGAITLNEAAAPELGALGNDWEGFYLTPGLNQIGFAYSDWVSIAPTFRMRYREVFL